VIEGYVPQTHEPGADAEVDFANQWVYLLGDLFPVHAAALVLGRAHGDPAVARRWRRTGNTTCGGAAHPEGKGILVRSDRYPSPRSMKLSEGRIMSVMRKLAFLQLRFAAVTLFASALVGFAWFFPRRVAESQGVAAGDVQSPRWEIPVLVVTMSVTVLFAVGGAVLAIYDSRRRRARGVSAKAAARPSKSAWRR
jgi:hypothetical protein